LSNLFSRIFSSDFIFSFNNDKLRSRELHATNLQSFRKKTERNPWFFREDEYKRRPQCYQEKTCQGTQETLCIVKIIAIFLIKSYKKYLSPFLPDSCRFYPSCSCYSREAIERHGFIKGMGLTLMRIVKCHPWHPGGYDPVKD